METTNLVQAFKNELNLTDQGLLELTEQKKGLVIDVTTEEGFKLARKERTEQNKILKNIDDLAISGKKSVDEARNVLKDRVSEIYSPTVTSFEAENIRRKEADRVKKEVEEKRVKAIHDQINSIRQFATNLFGKSSEELQGIIEAVDMIDVSENFAELTQEAMVVKKETLIELNKALASAIQNEQLEAEREKLRKEREDQEEQNRINEIKAKAQERLNTLIMIPSVFFGKTSDEINNKIQSLSNYEVKDEEFGELLHQANASKNQVIQQLNMMLDQQLIVEKSQEEERKAQVIENDSLNAERKRENDEYEAQQAFNRNLEAQRQEEKNSSKCFAEHEIKPLTKYEQMIKSVEFWANEYGVINSELSDLMNILNKYNPDLY